jgi:hypothetical protein
MKLTPNGYPDWDYDPPELSPGWTNDEGWTDEDRTVDHYRYRRHRRTQTQKEN